MTASRTKVLSDVQETRPNLNANQDEALARLHYLVENRRRVGLVLGDAGVGKTTLLRQFARDVRRSGGEVAVVNLGGASDLDVLWALVSGLGAQLSAAETRFRLWRAFQDRLQENRMQDLKTVLVFDHADQAGAEVMTLVHRIISGDGSQAASVTCLLAAQRSALEKLGTAIVEQVDLRIELEAWSFAETVQYLDERTGQAASSLRYRPDAVEQLHELTGGVPRQLVQLDQLARLAARADATKEIEPQLVATVFEELSGAGLVHQFAT